MVSWSAGLVGMTTMALAGMTEANALSLPAGQSELACMVVGLQEQVQESI